MNYHLSTEQMIEALTTFKEALEYVVDNTTGDSKSVVTEFIVRTTLQEKPYILVTTEGLQHITGLVFGNSTISDFILTLTYVFLGRYGGTDEQLEGLINNISRASSPVLNTANSQDKSLNNYIAIPRVVSDRLSDPFSTRNILLANHWLLSVLLIQLTASIAVKKHSTKTT